MHCFGSSLCNNVSLQMGDGKEYHVNYCRMSNLIYGLKDLFSHYKVRKNFFIFFDYIGKSRFYITIFSPLSMDISNRNPNKLLLQDVHKLVVANKLLSYRTSEQSSSGKFFNYVLFNALLMILLDDHNE